MNTQAITPVVPLPVAVAEDQPQNPGIEAVATTSPAPEDVLVERIAALWAENTTNRFELGKTLFELQELYALPGYGMFLERVKTLGIPQSTAYRLIKHYKDEAGLSQTEKDDDDDPEEPEESENKKVIVWLATPQKTKWDLAVQEIARIQGLNSSQAALYAVVETANRLSHPDAVDEVNPSPAPISQQEEELEELL